MLLAVWGVFLRGQAKDAKDVEGRAGSHVARWLGLMRRAVKRNVWGCLGAVWGR